MAGGNRTLVEREREVASLSAIVDTAAAGQGAVVLIEGPAGIGKTRLLAEVRQAAGASGATTLTARGSELEREFPFGVVRQLFEGPVLEAGEAAFAGAAGAARTVFEAGPAHADEPGPGSSFAALHGLFWVALNVAEERPLVLAVDDLHWCDRPSLRFFAYLVRRLEGVPLLLAATVRTTEPGTDPTILGEIAADPATVAVRPGPLTAPATAELVRARLGDEADQAFCDACHAATAGNPLLLGQLLTSLEADAVPPTAPNVQVVADIGPRAVSRTVQVRLARLQPEAAPVARAVAMLGEGAELPVVARYTGLDERTVAEAVGALARAEILRSEPPPGFVHPLVREAVYRELPQGERELEHARAAELLTEAGAPSEQVAAHLLAVPRRGDGAVVERLRSAAQAAVRKGGGDSAVGYLRRALEEPPSPEVSADVLLELGLAEIHTDGPAAVEHLLAAYESLGDPLARATAAVALARTQLFVGRADDTIALAQRARAELPPELEDLGYALDALELVTYYFGVEPPDFEARVEEVAGWRPDGSRPGASMLTAWLAHELSMSTLELERSVECAHEALDSGVLMQSDSGLLWVSAALALVHADREEALAVWDGALAVAHDRGSMFGALSVHLWRGYTLLERGQLPEAEESLREAFDEMLLWGFDQLETLSYPSGFLARILVERGDLDGAQAALDRSPPVQGTNNGAHARRHAEIELLLARSEWGRALEVVRELEQNLGRIENPAWMPWRALAARALGGLGRTGEAIEAAEAELEVALRWGARPPHGRALRVLGELRGDEAVLRESVAVLEASQAPLELAKSLGALGALVRRDRRPSEAREPLRRALELAGACGAGALAEHVRAELHASGARPRTEAQSGVGSLTASEKRIVGLAVDGQTNRDIAQALFVTPKTVEVHLTNAYRKLGVGSRRELPAALAA